MKTIDEICELLADALTPVIQTLSPEEQAGIPVALASLSGSTAKILKIYSEASLLEMLSKVAIESFNFTE